MHVATLVGDWKPVTDGEKLFHFLATNVGEFHGLNQLLHEDFTGIMRGREFARFTQGTVILHCFGRLFQAAKWYRDTNIDQPMKAVDKINEFVIAVLGIAKSTCIAFDDLAPLSLAAASASSKSSKTPNSIEKAKVIAACNKIFNCYSCGAILDPQAESHVMDSSTGDMVPNPQYLEHEHLWPHSFGGNSIAENLLPACPFCNREKKNLVSWEWAHVQAVLPKFQEGSPFLEDASRNIKIGLHIRAAFSYAVKYGCTLKDSYRLIGPRIENVYMLDQNDTPDFFNLRVHDAELTGITWG